MALAASKRQASKRKTQTEPNHAAGLGRQTAHQRDEKIGLAVFSFG